MNQKKLFTPGPLTTSDEVKQAAMQDLGSREEIFVDIIQKTCLEILELANINDAPYQVVMFPGSGTFGLDAVISSITPERGKWLILENGIYGQRLAEILAFYQLPHVTLSIDNRQTFTLEDIETLLKNDTEITHVGMVHCETSTGMLNNLEEIGVLVKHYEKTFFVDGMSSFAGIPIDFLKAEIDCLVTSSNKCIQGLPGVSIVIAKTDLLEQSKNNARSFSLDLYAQWRSFQSTRPFRFTPPVQILLGLKKALRQLQNEGGIQTRSKRYSDNQQYLVSSLEKIGLQCYLKHAYHSPIITPFILPAETNYENLFSTLKDNDCIIYPGVIKNSSTFRIGNIGNLHRQDFEKLVEHISEYL
jgi:2-aminoethylphosphonate-pyruvate transaminase